MNINIEYKVSLTQTELHRIIAAHCGFPLDSTIVLTVEGSNVEWIDVPPDWNKEHCPTEFPAGTIIDHMFLDGSVYSCNLRSYTAPWIQEGKDWTIVKYRISKG
jgi:hypothetical protein